MKLKMFVVFDSKVGAYLQPHFFRSTAEAVRAYTTACNDSQSNFNKYPSDYTFFEIGFYDDESGVTTMNESKISLGTALEFKSKESENMLSIT